MKTSPNCAQGHQKEDLIRNSPSDRILLHTEVHPIHLTSGDAERHQNLWVRNSSPWNNHCWNLQKNSIKPARIAAEYHTSAGYLSNGLYFKPAPTLMFWIKYESNQVHIVISFVNGRNHTIMGIMTDRPLPPVAYRSRLFYTLVCMHSAFLPYFIILHIATQSHPTALDLVENAGKIYFIEPPIENYIRCY